jgi:transketolase
VLKIDGHDIDVIDSSLASRKDRTKPLAIIADTIKGKGVSFMEHISMDSDQEYYAYHSGAPNLEEYNQACKELTKKIKALSSNLGVAIDSATNIEIEPISAPVNAEKMIPAYSEAILKLAEKNNNIVALDADLVLDTGLIPFKDKFPDRFIECGIAEQDMVSQAGTIALTGLVPIVHSFACFLVTRASEQIYNNASQKGKVIYVGSLAGILPAGPGHSHQAVRDFTGMLGMPGMTIIEPINANQVALALKWAVENNPESTYIRLTSIPFEQTELLNSIDTLDDGRGKVLNSGTDITLITYGPIFSFIAGEVAEILQDNNISLNIISTPWINKIDIEWLEEVIGDTKMIVTLENHYTESGAGSLYISKMASAGLLMNKRALNIGIEELPQCGLNDEVLEYHGLTSKQIAERIIKKFNGL